MQVLYTVEEVQKAVQKLHQNNQTLGFVPTMGALHKGHLNLVEVAQNENDTVLVSIFVNPTQFNNPQDLANYPRVPEQDLQLLKTKGVTFAFLPTVEEVYPVKAKVEAFEFNGLDEQMEGRFRPNHFKGVATVVKRLFTITQPTRAYFGEKDFQQLQIIRALAKSMHKAPTIVGVETQRSNKGLALSSRNQLLSKEHKEEALLIYNSLQWVKLNMHKLSVQHLLKEVELRFKASNLKLEYAEIAAEHDLKPVTQLSPIIPARMFIAAYAGSVRLIDNLPLN